MKEALIFAENAEILYGTHGVAANLNGEEWLRFHERNRDNYVLTMSAINPTEEFVISHHYYAMRGCITHISVRVQSSGERRNGNENILQ